MYRKGLTIILPFNEATSLGGIDGPFLSSIRALYFIRVSKITFERSYLLKLPFYRPSSWFAARKIEDAIRATLGDGKP